MADEPPRKIGSLRDRIAQFEKKPEPAAAPPRAAPKQWAWKAKQEAATAPTAATTAPTAATTDTSAATTGISATTDDPPSPRKTFSASDARESIAGGLGSLKERMAALQGRNVAAPKPKVVIERGPEPAADDADDTKDDDDDQERRARLAERMAKASIIVIIIIC